MRKDLAVCCCFWREKINDAFGWGKSLMLPAEEKTWLIVVCFSMEDFDCFAIEDFDASWVKCRCFSMGVFVASRWKTLIASRWKTLMRREGDIDASRCKTLVASWWKTLMRRLTFVLLDGRFLCVGWCLCFSMEDFDALVDVCASRWKTLMRWLTFVLLDGRLWWFLMEEFGASRWNTLMRRLTLMLLDGRLFMLCTEKRLYLCLSLSAEERRFYARLTKE